MHGSPGEGTLRRGQPWEAIARDSPLPDPFTLESFRAALEQWRGRPLTLAAVPLPSDRPALWVGTASHDYIVYEPTFLQSRQLKHQSLAHPQQPRTRNPLRSPQMLSRQSASRT
jgi:hypothetical protein